MTPPTNTYFWSDHLVNHGPTELQQSISLINELYIGLQNCARPDLVNDLHTKLFLQEDALSRLNRDRYDITAMVSQIQYRVEFLAPSPQYKEQDDDNLFEKRVVDLIGILHRMALLVSHQAAVRVNLVWLFKLIRTDEFKDLLMSTAFDAQHWFCKHSPKCSMTMINDLMGTWTDQQKRLLTYVSVRVSRGRANMSLVPVQHLQQSSSLLLTNLEYHKLLTCIRDQAPRINMTTTSSWIYADISEILSRYLFICTLLEDFFYETHIMHKLIPDDSDLYKDKVITYILDYAKKKAKHEQTSIHHPLLVLHC